MKYLHTKNVDIKKTPYADYDKCDWMMYFIERYGQIDGDHHKSWVLDQVARIHNNVKVIVKLAQWKKEDGSIHSEYRVWLDEPTQEYLNWVVEMKDGEDGPETYTYYEGIAP